MVPGCTKGFVRQDNKKWVWELYDATGQVIGRSVLEFDSKADAGLNLYAHSGIDQYPLVGFHNDTPKVG